MTLIEFYLNNPVVVFVMLMIAVGGVLGICIGVICDIRKKKKKRREDGEMTFREFTAWCNERVCDGCWGFNTVINCINAQKEVRLSPPWAREAAWQRVNRERNIVECFVKPTNKKIEESLRAGDEREKQSEIKVTGSNCYALGIDAKIVPKGLCGHPNKRSVNPEKLDGLPISERDWCHCVFCRDMKYCYFAGACEYIIKEAGDEQREAD